MIEVHDENHHLNYNQPAAHLTAAKATTTRYCSENGEGSSSHKTKKNKVANGTTSSDEKRPAAVEMIERGPHPLDQLGVEEVKAVAAAVNEFLLWTDYDGKIHPPDDGKNHPPPCPRFSVITLKEPPKAELLARANGFPAPRRQAHVIFMVPGSGLTYEATVVIVPAPGGASGLVGDVVNCTPLALGTQPLLSPEDFNLAENIVKEDAAVAKLLKERYHITDIGEI